MLSKNQTEENRKIYFRPEFTFCPHCEKKLQRAHTVWHKEITTLNGVVEVWKYSLHMQKYDLLTQRHLLQISGSRNARYETVILWWGCAKPCRRVVLYATYGGKGEPLQLFM